MDSLTKKLATSDMASNTRNKSTSSSSSDDLVTALLDPRIKDLLSQIISPLITDNINKAIDEKLIPITSAMSQFAADNDAIRQKCAYLENENISLKDANTTLSKQLDELTVYSRRDNLIINGLETQSFSDAASLSNVSNVSSLMLNQSNKSTGDAVIKFFQDALHITIDASEISVVHRLNIPSRGGHLSSSTRSPPLITVKFVRRQVRVK